MNSMPENPAFLPEGSKPSETPAGTAPPQAGPENAAPPAAGPANAAASQTSPAPPASAAAPPVSPPSGAAPPFRFPPGITPKPKTPFPAFTALDSAMACLMLPVGFLFVRWVMFSALGASVSLFTLIFTLVLFIYLKKSDVLLCKGDYARLSALPVLGAYFALSGHFFLKQVALLLLVYLAVYTVLAACRLHFSDFGPLYKLGEGILGFFILPFSNFGLCVRSIAGSARKTKRGKSALLALLGLLLVLPVLSSVLPLLLASDAAFSALWERMAARFLRLSPVDVLELCLGVPVAFYLYGLIAGGIYRRNAGKITEEKISKLSEKSRIAPQIFTGAFLLPLLLVYLLYFVSQLGYFLSAFRSMLPENYTYAEYARSGFFELMKIGLINALLLLLVTVFSKRQTGIVRAFSAALSVFTLLFAASAMSKTMLYAKMYGLTPLRLYAAWFMALLFAVFFLLLLPVKNPGKLVVRTGLAFFALLLLVSPDGFIARHNTSRYLSGSLDTVDVDFLAGLSAEAVPSIIRLAEEAPEEAVRVRALAALRSLRPYYVNQGEPPLFGGGKLRSWNLSPWYARRAIEAYAADTGKLPLPAPTY